jgi:phage shock protein PspC (stress-responsive transcriptional regulator)
VPAIAIAIDTSQRESVNALVAATVAEFGSVDILINCAAAPGGLERNNVEEADGDAHLMARDAKLVGVCSTLGERFGIDPTILRVGWIAVPLLTPVDFSTALVAYVVAGLYLIFQRKRANEQTIKSDFDRMG